MTQAINLITFIFLNNLKKVALRVLVLNFIN